MAQAQAQDIFTRGQAGDELCPFYEADEIEQIFATADACGFFADELAIRGRDLKVYVRAHRMSVNEPISYSITIR